MTALQKLGAAIDERAREIYDANGDDAAERADAKDLCRALARTLSGQSLYAAFGSPGDWGYSTPIGKALASVYSEQAAEGKSLDLLTSTLRELNDLKALLNTPEIEDFDKAVPLEAGHQIQRWGAAADAGKSPEDWFWLCGYLAGKALASFKAGDMIKAKHHCVSTSAAMRNWHAHIRSGESVMRPGLSEEKAAIVGE